MGVGENGRLEKGGRRRRRREGGGEVVEELGLREKERGSEG